VIAGDRRGKNRMDPKQNVSEKRFDKIRPENFFDVSLLSMEQFFAGISLRLSTT
jgi:hypothetical protein